MEWWERRDQSVLALRFLIIGALWCFLLATPTGAATTQVNFEYRNGFDYWKYVQIGSRHDLSYLEAEVKKQPDNVDLRFLLGCSYLRSDPDKSKQQFREILRLNRQHAESYFLLGMLEFAEGKFQAFYDYMEETIEMNPQHVQAYNMLGMMWSKTGQLDRAVLLMEQAKAHVKDEESFYFNQTLMLFKKQGPYEAIVANMEKAIRLSPREEYYFLLGVAYLKQHKWDSARAAMEKVVKMNPKNANALMGIATTYKELGNFKEAIAIAEKARAMEPDNQAIETELREYRGEYKRLPGVK